MKIVHIITRLILGGAQQNTVMSCHAQVERGHEVHLVYGPIHGPEGSLLAEAQRSGATLHEWPTMRRSIMPGKDVRCLFSLRQFLRRLKPDIVHTHSSKAGIIGRLAAWSARVPVVVHTVHGLAFHEQQSPWVSRAYVNIERLAARRCHHMIGITQAMVDLCLAEDTGRPDQFSVIPSGVDERMFAPPEDRAAERRRILAELGLRGDGKIIGIVARLDALKGHADLLEILPKLRARMGEVHLLCVGDGWNRKQLEAKARSQGIAGYVTWLGLVSLEKVPALLAAMDVMVLPSYQEGQSRTLVEALFCETPVVGYRVGGIPEVCIDGRTGLLVAPGDLDHLTAAITTMLENPQQARELARAGRDHCLANFSARGMTEKLESLYDRLARQRNAPGIFQAGGL
ncbi:MAG: glycosyltransferase family 4 protein [Phycisphaeraceae bacterium]|nr:glycosyltransferase family 4 protein [Phycisphaeraceae bacterium]